VEVLLPMDVTVRPLSWGVCVRDTVRDPDGHVTTAWQLKEFPRLHPHRWLRATTPRIAGIVNGQDQPAARFPSPTSPLAA
jgi:hypothetical protein